MLKVSLLFLLETCQSGLKFECILIENFSLDLFYHVPLRVRKIKRDLVPNPVLYPKYRADIPESLDQVELDEDGKERIDKFILKKKSVKERLGHKDKSDGERNYKDSHRHFKESDRSWKICDRIGHKSENKRKSSEESEIRKIEVISGLSDVSSFVILVDRE